MPTLSTRGYTLGIDPGLTTGWSIVNSDTGEEVSWLQIKFEDILQHLHTWDCVELGVDDIVVEDFALLGGKAKAQIGSRFETVQVIGMVKMWAWFTQTPVHLQAPSVKPLAERFTGRKPSGNHALSHHVDAYNHACYWLRQQGRYKTKLEREGM